MAYTPAGGVSGSNTSPYDFANYGQFNNMAYDNSVYGDFHNFNQITPFSAWAQKNIWGLSAPPPGMSYGAYQDRINVLSQRFSDYSVPSTIGSAASIFGAGMFMYSDLLSGGLNMAGKLTGSGALTKAGASVSKLSDVYGGLSTGLTSAIHTPLKYMFADPAGQIVGTFGDDLVNLANKFGGKYLGGFGNLGNMISEGSQKHIENFLSWKHGGAANAKPIIDAMKASGGTLGWMTSKAISAPLYIGASIATFMGMQAVLDTAIQGGINASGVGIQYEQDKIADTFEGLSDRVLSGPSGYKSKRFAADIAQHIREKSFSEANPSGIMGYFGGISDTTMGRFTGGWSAIKEMQTKTAQYALMAESGLLTKSNSAEEFIKKADAMYAAINKLGEALGQTTSKAMETARVLKSQGLSSPYEISNAGGAISTSAGMSGYSHNQVLAITGEASEAFRGTIFGQEMAFNMANNIVRRTAVGASAIGDNAFDKLSYTLRGKDSMNVFGVKVASELYNASEVKSMMIASMFEQTDDGYKYTGKINSSALSAALNGQNNYLTDEGTLGNLNAIFRLKDRTTQRAAERAMTDFSNNLSYPQMQKFISAVGRMRGYESDIELWDQRFREQGLDPTSARNMAKIFTADTRIQESNYAYFEQKQQQLSNYLEKENTKKYKSGLSELFYDYHEYTGRHTALAEAGFFGMAGMGVAALIPGAGVPLLIGSALVAGATGSYLSSNNYFENIGKQFGEGYGARTGFGSYIAAGASTAMLGKMAYGLSGGAIGFTEVAAKTPGLMMPTHAGLLARGFSLAAGGASAYVAAGYGQEYLGGETKGSKFAGGLVASVGAAAIPAMIMGGPLGWATLAMGGAVGVWKNYSDVYLSPETEAGQREALQNGMALLQGAERLRIVDPESYAAISRARGYARASIENASLQAYFNRASKGDISTLDNIAQAALRANYKSATPGASEFEMDGSYDEDSLIDNIWFSTAPKSSKITGAVGAINAAWSDIIKGTKSTSKNLDEFFTSLKDKESVTIGSGNEIILNRIRAISNLSGDSSTQSSIMNFLNNNYGMDKLKFIDADGYTVFNGFSNYTAGIHGQTYTQVADNIAKTVASVNSQIDTAIGAAGTKFVTAENAAGVAAVFNAFLRKDYDKAMEVGRNAGLTSDDLSRLRAFQDKLDDGRAKVMFNDLSRIINDQTHLVLKQGMNDFVTRKGAILGDSLNAVSSYMNYLYTGQRDEANLSKFDAIAKGNFESIQDSATREALREMYSTSTATEVLVRSANSGNWSVGQAREKIKSAGKLNSMTKGMMLSAMEGLSDTAAFSMHSDSVMKHINETVLRSNMGEASRSTSESVAQLQVEVLGRLDGSIKALNSILLATNLIKDENVRKNLSEAGNMSPSTTSQAGTAAINSQTATQGRTPYGDTSWSVVPSLRPSLKNENKIK